MNDYNFAAWVSNLVSDIKGRTQTGGGGGGGWEKGAVARIGPEEERRKQSSKAHHTLCSVPRRIRTVN
jgi:hypothetical protein